MLETNIRIVKPGKKLYINASQAIVTGPDLSADLLEKACSKLRNQHKLAALKIMANPPHLLVATTKKIPTIELKGDDWELKVEDAHKPVKRLVVTKPKDRYFMATLLERTLMIGLANHDKFWRLSDSTRIWYENEPFQVHSRVEAYRRYRIAAFPVLEEMIGIAINPETAFFTQDSLAYFFDPNLSGDAKEEREQQFNQMTNRQVGQKGTLIYDNSQTHTKCYFEKPPSGATCEKTGTIRAKGRSYDSLYQYYEKEFPQLKISQNDLAVQVSFQNNGRPQWVASKQVHVRIMNDFLPRRLSSVDKIKPNDRRKLINDFWQQLENNSGLKQVTLGITKDFWKPSLEHTRLFPIPTLVFGQNKKLSQPSVKGYRENYWQRLEMLTEVGCFDVPPMIPRTFYFAYPDTINEQIGKRLASDLVQMANCYVNHAKCVIKAASPISYSSVSEAIEQLKEKEPSIVIFVLNNEPIAYHKVANELNEWRVKRITVDALSKHYEFRTKGAFDKQQQKKSLEKGQSRWDDFIILNTLDTLQILDVIPFKFDKSNTYEAQLFIDVGYGKRFFALSLLFVRDANKKPTFLLKTRIYPKTDHHHETINPVILADYIEKLFNEVLTSRSTPIESLLILRDGQFGDKEYGGIDNAIDKLTQNGKLLETVTVDMVEFHKDSQKAIRLWEYDEKTGKANNPLEGQAVQLDNQTMVITSTGSPTLHQGTSYPYIIVGNGHCSDITKASEATFTSAQLNWSSPKVAQRLPIYAKRADEELRSRDSQEIKRYQ